MSGFYRDGFLNLQRFSPHIADKVRNSIWALATIRDVESWTCLSPLVVLVVLFVLMWFWAVRVDVWDW